MKKLQREDLLSLEAYSVERDAFRAGVMAHKKNRRLAIGPNLNLYFEDRMTMQYQVQEMLRIERIFEAEGINEELEAYNPLIPDGSNWKATFMVEFPDVEERTAMLTQLVGIENQEKTPAKSPWWLTLIRLLATALIILALAEPVLNPSREATLKGSGPVAIIVDNGWSAASHWTERTRMIERTIGDAEALGRSVVILPTASTAKTITAKIEAPNDARSSAAAIEPQPFKRLRASHFMDQV